MTSLTDRAKFYLARELARNRLPDTHNDDTFMVRAQRWDDLAKAALPEAEAAINAMTNVELLDLLGEVVKEYLNN